MSNVEQARRNFLALAGGDKDRALDIAADAYVKAWESRSAGYTRDKPSHSPLALHKTRAAPVLIAGEAPHG